MKNNIYITPLYIPILSPRQRPAMNDEQNEHFILSCFHGSKVVFSLTS